MKVYADSSFLVALYSADVHSFKAEQRVRQFAPEILLTPLTELELANALHLRVFRREASAEEIRASKKHLDEDIRTGVFSAVAMPADAYDLARRISAKNTAAIGTRALDILHVANAILLHTDEFWSFDGRQRELAEAEGLKHR